MDIQNKKSCRHAIGFFDVFRFWASGRTVCAKCSKPIMLKNSAGNKIRIPLFVLCCIIVHIAFCLLLIVLVLKFRLLELYEAFLMYGGPLIWLLTASIRWPLLYIAAYLLLRLEKWVDAAEGEPHSAAPALREELVYLLRRVMLGKKAVTETLVCKTCATPIRCKNPPARFLMLLVALSISAVLAFNSYINDLLQGLPLISVIAIKAAIVLGVFAGLGILRIASTKWAHTEREDCNLPVHEPFTHSP